VAHEQQGHPKAKRGGGDEKEIDRGENASCDQMKSGIRQRGKKAHHKNGLAYRGLPFQVWEDWVGKGIVGRKKKKALAPGVGVDISGVEPTFCAGTHTIIRALGLEAAENEETNQLSSAVWV